MLIKRKSFFLIIIICIASLFLFKKGILTFFVQDDFFHLNFSKAGNFLDFFNFFSFKNFGYGFYRPLTTQVFLFICQELFGKNYLGFKIVSFIVFCLNIFLCNKIFKILLKEDKISLFACMIYGLSSFHLTTLSYLSAFEEIGVTFFFFLSFLTYLKSRKISILFFIFALLSRETAITLPIVLLMYEIIVKQDTDLRKKVKNILPYFLVLIIYLLLRYFFKLFPENAVYPFTFSPKKVVNNYFWYSLWSLGAPESLIDFIGPGLKINQRFFLYFPPLGLLVLIFPIIITLTFFIKNIFFFIKQKNERIHYFLIVWFVVTLLPFVILQNHRFAYYLEIPFFGLCGLIGMVFNKAKTIKIFFVLLFLLGSFFTVSFYNKTYWVINRAKIAKKIISELKVKYPNLPKQSNIVFLNDPDYSSPSKEWGKTSSQVKVAISGCEALKFIYADGSLKCFFEDDGRFWPKDAYLIMAKID